MTPPANPERLVTPRFALVVAAGFAYFTALGMLLPVVPVYVDKRLGGGGLAVGVAVGALFVSAVLCRPFAGRIGDRFGRRVLLIGGATIVGVATALYASSESFPVLVAARLLTGVGEAGFFVGGATMITDLAPAVRRGEAISYWSVGVFGGLALGPLLGESVLGANDYATVWFVAAGLAFVAALLATGTRDVPRPPGAPVHSKLINRAALGPGTLLFLGMMPLAAFNSFVPLYVDEIGLHGADGIFVLYGVLVLVVRIFGARIPDRLGGRVTGATALLCNAAGMAVIVSWHSAAGLILGTVIFSAGMSLLYPAFFLLALDGVAETERASAVGTISVFFDLSQGLGAVIVGGVAALTDIPGAFAAGGAAALLGLCAMRAVTARFGRVRARAGLTIDGPVPSLLVTNDFPPKVGGIQSYLHELWRRLPPADTTVLTTPYEGASAWDAQQAFRVERTREGWLLPTPRLARRADALARDVGAEVVFLDPMIPLGGIGRQLQHAPYVVIVHGAEVTVPGHVPGLHQASGMVLRGAAGIVAAGEYAARQAARAAGRALPTLVVPPGVDPARFCPLDDDERRAVRQRHGLDPDRPLVLGVSRLVPRKGFDVLLDAVAGLADVQVAIAGAGRDRKRLEGHARPLGARAHLLGRVPDADLPALYASADVFAMLCRDRWGGLEAEGFGIVFVEAGACGVPAVAGRSGGSHEAVVDGETGLVVDPRDVVAVRDAIRTLLADDGLRRRLGAAARERAVGSLAYDVLAGRLAPLAGGDLSVLARTGTPG